VAVSRNYLLGYVINDPNLRVLVGRTPLICFQGALCLFDVRNSQ
jgi:hypothetical protein